jgi:hypothetical protein
VPGPENEVSAPWFTPWPMYVPVAQGGQPGINSSARKESVQR